MTYKQAIHELKRDCWYRDAECDCLRTCKENNDCHIKTAIEALEKQIPKKPILQRENNLDYYYCPVCEKPINDYYPMNRVAIKEHHCVCGQKIDWGDEE